MINNTSMALPDPDKINEVELRNFLVTGAEFFRWNAGKNTPNILENLSERIGALRNTMKEASDSSAKLATALNRFTFALVFVGAIGLFLQAVSICLHLRP
jgi:hypothetical protein